MTDSGFLDELLAKEQDYLGFHGTAHALRVGWVDNFDRFFLLIFLPLFPVWWVFSVVITGRTHHPNCDCERIPQEVHP